MARRIARSDRVERHELIAFLATRHRAMLVTTRRGGGSQLSPVSCGIDGGGRLVVSTYPSRAKVANIRCEPSVSAMVISDDWDGPWVQLDGRAEVLDLPDALDGLVDYYRCIAGEHPDWEEYREAMTTQGKCLIRMTIQRWGPVATGGFPPEHG
jgi:PPOX class probable F420-dependent enzyme